MKLARHLAQGVSGWLKYEYNCRREWLFCERYLTVPVSQILSSEYSGRVFSEFQHPVLVKHKSGSGARPKVDFAVIDPNDFTNIKIAVETKWVNKSGLRISDLLWDLVRLELFTHETQCLALFLIAGRSKYLSKIFTTDEFLCPSENCKVRPVLKIDNRRSMGLRLDNPPKQRVPVIRELFKKYPSIHMPTRIVSGRPFVSPKTCNANDYQVYVWEITCSQNRQSFLPSNHRFYNDQVK